MRLLFKCVLGRYVASTVILVPKLQALVYDILPSTTAVFSYAIGSRKLSANEQFFVGAQTVISLLQTTQIISDVCFITDRVAYASSNKTKIVHVYVRAWALGCFYGHISTHTPSIAFRHLPPNSARFGYATEGALFISAQLSIGTGAQDVHLDFHTAPDLCRTGVVSLCL